MFKSLATEICKYLHGVSPTILVILVKYIFLVSKNLGFGTPKYKILAPCLVLKSILKNGNSTAHVVYANHFCNMLVLYSSAAVPLSQLLIYLKLMFILRNACKNYSYKIYLGIWFVLKNYRQLTLIES